MIYRVQVSSVRAPETDSDWDTIADCDDVERVIRIAQKSAKTKQHAWVRVQVAQWVTFSETQIEEEAP